MGGRRKAREQALQVLCLIDVQPELTADQAMGLYHRHLREDGSAVPERSGEEEGAQLDRPDRPDGPDVADAPDVTDGTDMGRFTDGLVRGVRGAIEELDGLISKSSRNWRLERMTWVDRNLLRLAAYELRFRPEVPAKVAINEAIEVAKRFGTAESPAFVNGVLDRLMADLGRRA